MKKRKFFKHASARPVRFINGTKGVISLFLAILMVPFTVIAGSLINAARINSAVAIFDEALCNASDSTLGTYDSFLRKRFGLLAMGQDVSSKGWELSRYTVSDLISETFNKYMEENMKVLSNTYTSAEIAATGIYPLSDTNVLRRQILETSKYSVPTQLVVDGLSLNDMIADLEKCIPGKEILDLVTSGAKVADSMVTLAKDFELLKDAVSEQATADTNYQTAYSTFASVVRTYRSKKQEMSITLEQKQTVIDTKYENAKSVIDGLVAKEKTLSDLKERQRKEGVNLSSQISAAQSALNDYRAVNADKIEPWEEAKDDYDTTKRDYESALAKLLEKVKTAKQDYSSKISTFMSKLSATKDKLTAVQTDITKMGDSIVGMGEVAINTATEKTIKKNKDAISKNKEKIAASSNEEEKKALQEQNTALEESNRNLGDDKAFVKAQKTGFQSATQSIRDSIAKVNTNQYSIEYEKLKNLKLDKVDKYDTSSVPAVGSSYYVTIAKIMTSTDVETAEKEMVKDLAADAIWAVLKALFGFIEALFNAASVYDPNLRAVIDSSYYKDTYGGLPSEKNRTTYPLSMGEPGDADLSQEFKDLIGGYTGNGDMNPSGMDIITKIFNIVKDIGVISTNVLAITNLIGLLNLSERIQKIMDAADRVVQNIKDVLAYFANMFSGSALGQKLLLSGYVSYMTSNRTTYKNASPIGGAYNLRQQTVPTGLKSSPINNFIALVETVTEAITGGNEKCFFGAETEYILFGTKSEIVNQSAAFLMIYILRTLISIPVVLSNAEVQSIAAASTIASPVVLLITILLEGLVDTIILVNGGKLVLWKNFVYLSPSGIPKLIKKFSSLSLSTSQMDGVKKDYLKAAHAEDAKYEETDATDKSYFDMDYTQTLYILMLVFTSQEKMLQRMSNIIEMEAVENMCNKGMGSNKKFDLDYSYTFVRSQAKFTTNEFISISDGTGLTAKERIMYRGY